MNQVEKEQTLVKTVLSTGKGKELLALWADMYVYTPIFTSNANELAARVGMQELIVNLMHQAGVINDGR